MNNKSDVDEILDGLKTHYLRTTDPDLSARLEKAIRLYRRGMSIQQQLENKQIKK